jgi:AraC-like DNA-binding protein
MHNQINTTLSENLRPFIEYFDKHGIYWTETADKHNIPIDGVMDSLWLPSDQVMNFLLEMNRMTQKNLGYEVGKSLSLVDISPALDREISECGDIEACMHKLIDIMPQLNSHVVVWTEKIDGLWFLCHRSAYSSKSVGYDQSEWFRTFALVSLCRQFTNEAWVPKRVFMSFPAHLADNNAVDNNIYSFNHPNGAIQVPLSSNFTPVQDDGRDLDWITRIRRLSATYAVLPCFTVQWFGHLIGLSTRTLHRRLELNGTSFKALRDEVRNQHAKRLLVVERLMPQDVAWRCGYNDLSNFNRAFKSWNDCTPSQFRKRKL